MTATDKYTFVLQCVTKALDDHSMELSRAEYIEMCEELSEEFDSRARASRDDDERESNALLARDDDGEAA